MMNLCSAQAGKFTEVPPLSMRSNSPIRQFPCAFPGGLFAELRGLSRRAVAGAELNRAFD